VGVPCAALEGDGQLYFEVEVVKAEGLQQFGFATDGFKAGRGDGVGDDKRSWGVDGGRVQSWTGGSQAFGRGWKDGDVVQFSFDVKDGKGTFRCGINGSFEAPLGLVLGCCYSAFWFHIYSSCIPFIIIISAIPSLSFIGLLCFQVCEGVEVGDKVWPAFSANNGQYRFHFKDFKHKA
jgi:hypothetical protein